MKKCNKGMTMIEILVAFVMLTLVMVILYSSMKFASNLLRESTDLDNKNALFQKAVSESFKDASGYERVTSDSVTYVFEGTDSNGVSVGTINYNIKTVGVYYKKDDTGYVETTDTSDDNARRLYLFSTKE